MKYKIKITMVTKLTSAALKKITNDPSLFADVSVILGVKGGSLAQLIYRNSSRLTTHEVVVKVAEKMKKDPKDILERSAVKKRMSTVKQS